MNTFHSCNQNLVIIGGGVSGIFTLCKLIDLKIDHDCFLPIHITLIEKNNALGEGMAYTNYHDSNLLNTAAGLLSNMGGQNKFCLNNQPSFLKWIRNNIPIWHQHYPALSVQNISKNNYLPRGMIGIYLRDILEYYIKIANHYEAHIDIIYDEAVDIEKYHDQHFKIILRNHDAIHCEKLVLALGGFLRTAFPFTEHPGYFTNPWPQNQNLTRLLSSKSIAIIGTKLSALDTLGILEKNNYKGKIFLLSRTGFLPTVKKNHYEYQPKIIHQYALHQLTHGYTRALRLNDFFNLIKCELEYAAGRAIHWHKILKARRFSLPWLRWQIQLANSSTSLWQSVLAAIDECIIIAWQNLQPEDKHKFMQSFAFFWDTYRFSMPVETAYQVWRLLTSKQLTICSDLNAVASVNSKFFEFSAFDRCRNVVIHEKVNALVNAAGINYNMNEVDSLLIKNLIRKQIVKPHPLGGFLLDSPHYNLLNYKNIYALGDLTKGSHFFTNSYLICSQQAACVASLIFSTLKTNI